MGRAFLDISPCEVSAIYRTAQVVGELLWLNFTHSDPILKDHFWMNPFAKHFSTIKASDLVLLDSDGFVVEGGAQLPVNEAGFLIHSEIHKARPDVVAAAHTHGIHGKTWSSFGKPIEMLTQGKAWIRVEYVLSTDRNPRRMQLLWWIRCL